MLLSWRWFIMAKCMVLCGNKLFCISHLQKKLPCFIKDGTWFQDVSGKEDSWMDKRTEEALAIAIYLNDKVLPHPRLVSMLLGLVSFNRIQILCLCSMRWMGGIRMDTSGVCGQSAQSMTRYIWLPAERENHQLIGTHNFKSFLC